jgi:hypothetical protein
LSRPGGEGKIKASWKQAGFSASAETWRALPITDWGRERVIS